MAFDFKTGTTSNTNNSGSTTFGFSNQTSGNIFGNTLNGSSNNAQTNRISIFGTPSSSVNNGNGFGSTPSQNTGSFPANNTSNNTNNNNVFGSTSNPFFSTSLSSAATGTGSDFKSQANNGFGSSTKTNTMKSNDTNLTFTRPQTSSSSGQLSSVYHNANVNTRSKFKAASIDMPLPKNITEFINNVNKSLSNLDPIGNFCGAYLIVENPRYISELQMNLDSTHSYSDHIDKAFEHSEFSNINNFVTSFLRLICEFQFESILNSIDLVLAYFNQLIVFFNNNDSISPCLYELILREINFVYRISMKCDKALFQYNINRSYPIISNLSGLLSKLFNNCKKNLSRNPVKKSLLLKISNIMLEIFFKIDQPLNSNTIFITNHLNFKTLKGKDFLPSDLIKYRYYLGKYLMITNFFQLALVQFKACYQNYPISNLNSKNFENILERFIILLIINGYKPNGVLINQLQDIYKRNLYFEIFNSIKMGNISKFRQTLNENEEYLRSKQLYAIIYKTCLIICYRNLFLRIFKILNSSTLPNSYNNIVDYNALLAALRVSNPQEAFTLLQVEELLVSLIEKKWIKGIIFTSSNKLSVSKKNDYFPPMVSNIDYSKNEYDWLDKK